MGEAGHRPASLHPPGARGLRSPAQRPGAAAHVCGRSRTRPSQCHSPAARAIEAAGGLHDGRLHHRPRRAASSLHHLPALGAKLLLALSARSPDSPALYIPRGAGELSMRPRWALRGATPGTIRHAGGERGRRTAARGSEGRVAEGFGNPSGRPARAGRRAGRNARIHFGHKGGDGPCSKKVKSRRSYRRLSRLKGTWRALRTGAPHG